MFCVFLFLVRCLWSAFFLLLSLTPISSRWFRLTDCHFRINVRFHFNIKSKITYNFAGARVHTPRAYVAREDQCHAYRSLIGIFNAFELHTHTNLLNSILEISPHFFSSYSSCFSCFDFSLISSVFFFLSFPFALLAIFGFSCGR